MGYIDLHVHSSASDGTLSPGDVLRRAAARQLDAIALTDHDTTDGLADAMKAICELQESGAYTPELIPGIEMSCVYLGTEIHILGLYVDPDSRILAHGLKDIRLARTRRNLTMLEHFQEDGFSITFEDLIRENPDTVITRAHFARVLVDKGYCSTMKQAFEKYLAYGGRYCQRKEELKPERAMELLVQAGAFPVLAHPLQYHLGYGGVEELVLFLKELGLKGLEVYHSSNNACESSKLKQIAKKYHLLPSGGSDFHGSNKPDIEIGTGRGGLRISHLLLDDIKEAHYGRII